MLPLLLLLLLLLRVALQVKEILWQSLDILEHKLHNLTAGVQTALGETQAY